MQQLGGQPRAHEGNFWHKAIYPNQVWLGGIYMAQPLMAYPMLRARGWARWAKSMPPKAKRPSTASWRNI